MKNITLLIIALVGFVQFAIADGNSTSNINEVTVYKQQAKVTRVATMTVPAGNSEIVFSDLTTAINAQSLQVAINNGVTLLSASYRTNYLKDQVKSARVESLNDSLEMLDYEATWLSDQRVIYQGEEAVIKANNKLGSTEKGMTTQELRELTQFYRSKLMEIRKNLLNLSVKEKNVNELRNKIRTQLSSLNALTQKPTGEIVLKINSKTTTKANFRCSYIVTNAGWSPVYDLRSKGIDKEILLSYKANISQNTGYDWNNVKLTLSSGNPSLNNSRPILKPRYVTFYVANTYVQEKSGYTNFQMMNSNMATMDAPVITGGTAPPPVAVNDAGVNVTFEIRDRYDVPSDGQQHLVAVQDHKLNADYEYHAVPSMECAAFLLAKVTDWGKYNLQPGNANIFFEDMYIGQSYLNPNTTSDTLLLSLGRDEKITVKRLKLNEFSSSKFIGSNKKETIAYETLIRNTKNVPIKIEILDQIPISNNKEIEVELIDKKGARYTKDYGKLLWDLELQPGETKRIKFIYSVKYPKDKYVTGK